MFVHDQFENISLTCLLEGLLKVTKVANKEHQVGVQLNSQVQPLPCKVAADKHCKRKRSKIKDKTQNIKDKR